MDRALLGVICVGTHAEGAARYPDHSGRVARTFDRERQQVVHQAPVRRLACAGGIIERLLHAALIYVKAGTISARMIWINVPGPERADEASPEHRGVARGSLEGAGRVGVRSRRRSCLAAVALLPVLAGCGASQAFAPYATQADLQRFAATAHASVDCRAAAARNPRYRILDRRMPLADIGAASLGQMTDQDLATNGEVAALAAWTAELNACRAPILQVANETFPAFGPIIEAARDDDDAILVDLAQRKLPWGKAVLRLKGTRTKLRADLIAHSDQVLGESRRLQQEQLNRRVKLLSTVLDIL